MLNGDSSRIGVKSLYDPIKRAKEIAGIVTKGDFRRYHRFRPARFYGGIGTADCVGCCLRCLFCWSWDKVLKPGRYGKLYSPNQVAGKLTTIAHKKGFRQVRISGNEPTLSRNHLLRVIDLMPRDILFILETNGILIGYDKTYAEDLARYENLYVRVSLKGTNEEEFSALTGAEPRGFKWQIQALENLYQAGASVHPAAMVSFSRLENVQLLKKRLGAIDADFQDIEVEELVLYGDVEERLLKAGMKYHTAYQPKGVPTEQV